MTKVKETFPVDYSHEAASEILGKALSGELEGIQDNDLTQVMIALKRQAMHGSPQAGTAFIKCKEYLDKKSQGATGRYELSADDIARLCVRAIRELRESGERMAEVPILADVFPEGLWEDKG